MLPPLALLLRCWVIKSAVNDDDDVEASRSRRIA